MTLREAACHCGQLRVTADGEPIRTSMCHCRAWQRQTGSAFGVQARFPAERVGITGRHGVYVRTSDDGEGRGSFHFCPDCGSTVFYTISSAPDAVAIPIGGFADPLFPAPTISVYESRRHPWLTLPATIEQHYD